jgi:hypothetical protein
VLKHFVRGALATFATNGSCPTLRCILSSQGLIPPSATGFSKAFPGIKPHLLTLESNFRAPFYRDILMLMGVCSVSKESCQNILGLGGGSAITIVVGGAAESLSARPGTADLTLRKRYGTTGSKRLSLLLHLLLRPASSDSGLSRLPSGRGALNESVYRARDVNVVVGLTWCLYSRLGRMM